MLVCALDIFTLRLFKGKFSKLQGMFHLPVWLQDLTDIGYNHIRGVQSSKSSQATEIARIRRTRNPGNKLPPPFPNGWYMVIESCFLRRRQVVSVDIIGRQHFVGNFLRPKLVKEKMVSI